MTTINSQTELEQVVATIQKRWGIRALRRLERTAGAQGLPTGYAALDKLLGTGIPRGAITCISGQATSGKVTLVLDTLVRTQGRGEVTVVVDTGGRLDAEYAERRGVDLTRLLLVCPQPSLVGLDIARDLVAGGGAACSGAGLVVVDTGGFAGSLEGLAIALRRLQAAVRQSAYALVCLTSLPATRIAGALIESADTHLRLERRRWLWEAHRMSGYEVAVTVEKTRFGSPGGQVTLPFWIGSIRLNEPERSTP